MLLFTSGALVAGLYWSAYARLRTTNSFLRLFPPHVLGSRKQIELPSNAYYFAGQIGDTLFLGNRLYPQRVIKVHQESMDTTIYHFSVNSSPNTLSYWSLHVAQASWLWYNSASGERYVSSSPYTDSLTPGIDRQPLHGAVTLSPNYMVTKTFDSQRSSRCLQKTAIDHALLPNIYYPRQQIEGIYSTDGMLLFNRNWNQLIYLHHFTNRITLLDTNLNEQTHQQTIDLTDSIKGNIITSTESGVTKQKLEGSIVNQDACTDGNLLLVLSKAPAKNQTLASFRKSATVDIYTFPDLNYRHSFYLPLAKDHTTLDIQLVGSYLYVLHGTALVRYGLQLREADAPNGRTTNTVMGSRLSSSNIPCLRNDCATRDIGSVNSASTVISIR